MSEASRPFVVNKCMYVLKPQSNGPLYINTGWEHWPLMGELLHLVQRGSALACCGPAQSPICTKRTRVPTSNYWMWHYNCLCAPNG